jgi:hypothetical protein
VRFVLPALACLLAVASPGFAASTPLALYGPADGAITAFAQDGSLLAFLTHGGRSCNAVHVVSLSGVEAMLPKPGTSNVTCRWDMEGPAPQLAIAAGSGAALWTLHESASTEFDYVVGASAQRPTERRFSEIAHSKQGAGLWLGGIAGEGKTLVYSVAGVAYADQLACLAGGSCAQRVRGGGIDRVVGRRIVTVRGTGPAIQLATAAGRIAYVPAVAVVGGAPAPSPSQPIEVRNAKTGALVARALPGGTPVALALSPHVLAVLVRAGSALSVVWFDATSGRRLGRVRVSRHAAPELAASDQDVVYRVGRVVHAVDVDTREISRVVQTRTTPIGLSLEGSRLAWAENIRGRGWVRAIFLRGRG